MKRYIIVRGRCGNPSDCMQFVTHTNSRLFGRFLVTFYATFTPASKWDYVVLTTRQNWKSIVDDWYDTAEATGLI